MKITGYLIYVPLENVASMEYGGLYQPDKATVATTPGHLAGPFEVREIVRSEPGNPHVHFGQREGECKCPADCDCWKPVCSEFPVCDGFHEPGQCPVPDRTERYRRRLEGPPGLPPFQRPE